MTEPSKIDAPEKFLSSSETILLVEDIDKLRALLSKILRLQGYTVLEAANGQEALALCQRQQLPIQILVTDMVMPHINGRKLAEKLWRRNPEMQVIFISGYAADSTTIEGIDELNIAFVQKPFNPSVLLEKVQQAVSKLHHSCG